MLIYTPEELDISKLDVENTKQWVILLEHDGTPYEIFCDVPFLTTDQAGQLNEHKSLLLIFDDETAATETFDKICGNNKKHLYDGLGCNAKAVLIHNGLLIDDTEN